MCPPHTSTTRIRSCRLLALLLGAALLAGCNTVEYYEMGAFSDGVMQHGPDAAETHFHQKIFYSMEGSAGGIGTSAGGGCGCY